MKLIELTKNQFAIVDDVDYETLSKHKWHAKKTRHGYCAARNAAIAPGQRKTEYMHIVIAERCGLNTDMIIDHIDGDSLNNQRNNLRPATNKENCCNRPLKNKNNTAGLKGVTFAKKYNKWQAQIRHNGRRIWLGYFDDVNAAARAYDEKAIELFGEFANPNFK